MRKILSLILIICLVTTLVACDNVKDTQPTEPEYFYKNEYIAINDYTNMVFDFYQFEVTDYDLEMYINYYIRLPNATYTPVYEGTVAKEDYIHINVQTTDSDGNVIDEYSTDELGRFLYVGIGDFIAGLDDVVIGMKVGDTKTVKTKLKVNDVATEVSVSVTVNYIQITEMPEATDELAKKAGYKSLQAFKDEYKAKLEAEYAADAYDVFLTNVSKKVIVEIFEYPEAWIASYIAQYRDSAEMYAAMYSLSLEEYLKQFANMTVKEWEAQLYDAAKEDVAIELMLIAILESNGLELDDAAYAHYLNLMAKENETTSGLLELIMKNQGKEEELVRELKMRYGYDVFVLTAKMRLVDWKTGDIIVDYVEQSN